MPSSAYGSSRREPEPYPALGEAALLAGDADRASEQFARALELLGRLSIPYDHAEIELRAGVALARAGNRGRAVDRLTDAYRIARRLGARPLAAAAAEALQGLGERVDVRLGRRAGGDLERAGLSQRELQVLRLVAAGRTNREIAQELFLSPRTVDMHVRNTLAKLDSQSRVEAAGRARDLGLL